MFEGLVQQPASEMEETGDVWQHAWYLRQSLDVVSISCCIIPTDVTTAT